MTISPQPLVLVGLGVKVTGRGPQREETINLDGEWTPEQCRQWDANEGGVEEWEDDFAGAYGYDEGDH